MSALFIDDDSTKIRRFVKITQLKIPYRIIPGERLSVWLQDAIQELVFIDRSREHIFYRIQMPGNTTTPLDYKRKALDKALAVYDENSD